MTVLPNFISNAFLQEIFRNHFGKNLIVHSFWGEWATKKGDNYASDMYRVHVHYELDGMKTKKPVLFKVNLR